MVSPRRPFRVFVTDALLEMRGGGAASRSGDWSRRAWLAVLGRALASSVLTSSAFTSCRFEEAPTGERLVAEQRDTPVLVLVVLDGVRREDVLPGAIGSDGGLAPRLAEMATRLGCHIGGEAAPMFASGPDYVSLPGYAEILTGSPRAGCIDNDCPRVLQPTLLEDFAAALPGDEGRVALVGSWPELDRVVARGPPKGAVSVGRTRGHDHRQFRRWRAAAQALALGAVAHPDPGWGGYRPDVHTAALALAYLEGAKPRLLVVCLGDADEYAHRGDLGGYRRAVTFADSFVDRVRAALAGVEERGRPTALFVTTDHGRARHLVDHGARWPESARAWLVACGSLVGARGAVGASTTRYLADIAPTLRWLGGVDAPGRPGGVAQQGCVLSELELLSGS